MRPLTPRPLVSPILTVSLKRREAFEEVLSSSHLTLFCADAAQIGLPQDKDKLPLLCILDPFIAGNEVLVTPCAPFLLPRPAFTMLPIRIARHTQRGRAHPRQHPQGLSLPCFPSKLKPARN